MSITTESQQAEETDDSQPLITPFRLLAGLAMIGLGLWIGLYPGDWQHWLGFTKSDYFTEGQNYAFYSGVGPMLLTGLGLSTIISGLWHHLNCHASGCPRIVRHKIAGGEYGVCSTHWRQVHPDAGRKHTIAHLREHHHAHLKATGRWPGA